MTSMLAAPIDGGVIKPIQTTEDREAAASWLTSPREFIAVDSETTGLAYDAEVRLVQFGDQKTAWVATPDHYMELVELLYKIDTPLVMHNAPFDSLHLARLLDPGDVVGRVTKLLSRTTDTSILAHLIDPREKRHGGTGHSLKPLSEHWVDPNAPDSDAELKSLFRSLGLSVADGYAQVPLDNETFLTYSGMDVLLAARLHDVLAKEVADIGLEHLNEFEHRAQQIVTAMTARGIKVDLPYAHELSEELLAEQTNAERRAAELGVENTNSTNQVSAALLERGLTLTDKTPSGQLKVDRKILEALDDELAVQVLAAKNASKALTSWVDPLIDAAWNDGRVHCRIRSVAARTGRQSISNPPLQQLPANDHRIRSCIQADDGQSLVAADFDTIEMRVLAVLANEETMIQAFADGENLHDTTASRLFGSDFTQEQRRLAKGVGFGLIYGGGVDTLARQSGISKLEAQSAIDKFHRAFPRVKRWSNQLTEKVKYGEPLVITGTGRRIPVERDFCYRAVNYSIQSLAADLFKGSLIQLDESGFGDHLLLPIHDEVLTQTETENADEFANDLASTMSGQLGPVPITASAEVIGDNWGIKYQEKVNG